MAKFNEVYYSGSDQYSDGDVENEILELVEQQVAFDSLNQVSYPIVYHLSKVRQNIFLWYPFRKNARILEVGAGCGAITGVLCEKAAEVVAVELSKRRATINYKRNKHYENLEIMVGNLNDIPVKAEFDYIILNGVFEYAGGFTEGAHPYESFLQGMAARLKPDGTILIAIENRLGAKYFAGAPEDHTDKYFLGLNQYKDVDTVKTFSKQELQQLCESVGMICNRFYYPYPDYKFPYEIFTDETINTPLYGRPMFQFSDKKLELFSEAGFCQTLAKEGIADKFANSFLVEVQKEYSQPEKNIKYVKLNTDRNPEFQIYTTIWEEKGQNYVGKAAVSPKAEAHVKYMNSVEAPALSSWEYLLGQYQGETVIYPYLNAPTLNDRVSELTAQGKREQLLFLIKEFYENFFADSQVLDNYQTVQFREVFGEAVCEGAKECCCNLDIDLIFDNIFCLEDTYKVIDTEWVFPFYIPTAYVMWRVINELYYKHTGLEQLIKRRELEEDYGITEADARVFKQWEVHFAYTYVGSYGLKKYEKQPLRPVMEQVAAYYGRERYMDSKLYINTGNGYNETETIASHILLKDGKFIIRLQLPEGKTIMSLRWDPADFPCICQVVSVKGTDGVFKCIPQNHLKSEEGWDLFFTNDPNYEIKGKINGTSELILEGSISYLSQEEMLERLGTVMPKRKKEPRGNFIARVIRKVTAKGAR